MESKTTSETNANACLEVVKLGEKVKSNCAAMLETLTKRVFKWHFFSSNEIPFITVHLYVSLYPNFITTRQSHTFPNRLLQYLSCFPFSFSSIFIPRSNLQSIWAFTIHRSNIKIKKSPIFYIKLNYSNFIY